MKLIKKLVGKYRLGFRVVNLYVTTENANGHVDLISDGTEIVVGIDSNWSETVSILLHEAYECVLVDLNVRYKQNPAFSFDSSDFIFLMTHNQLSEAHERVAYFLVECLEEFEKIYKKLHRR